jgi:hypothetical protein
MCSLEAIKIVESSQFTSLRTPLKWHACKEGQRFQQRKLRRAFFRFTVNREISYFALLIAEVASSDFPRLIRLFKKYMSKDDPSESYSPLSDSNCSHCACCSPSGLKSASPDAPN